MFLTTITGGIATKIEIDQRQRLRDALQIAGLEIRDDRGTALDPDRCALDYGLGPDSVLFIDSPVGTGG